MFKFAVVTFGCRVNQADSFDGERRLRDAGGVPADEDQADLVLVNTCSVTAAADQAARHAIRRIARRNPSARIVATGCYATRNPAGVQRLPGVVSIVENSRKERLADVLFPAAGPEAAGRRPEPGAGSPQPYAFRPGDRGRTAFPLRVQTGCDESCSYCTIPASRGPSRSRPLVEALSEARGLVASGYKELILTGVHLGAYGRDLRPASSLVALLEALDRLPGDFTVRISSLEPMDCPPEVIRLVAASGRFAPHFHFPLQHASDRLLASMNRPYRLADYRALVDLTRAALPDAAIGCDVIVGFPGESAEDHADLERFLSSSPVTHLHVFPYSERPGTPAASMAGQIEATVTAGRASELRALSEQLRAAFLATQLGTVRPALTIDDGSRAVTDNSLAVAIPPGRQRNERIRVRLLAAAPLRGEVVA
jgi:threonylcarbamoyladenosine tRNA methylthiotransferase MtaB